MTFVDDGASVLQTLAGKANPIADCLSRPPTVSGVPAGGGQGSGLVVSVLTDPLRLCNFASPSESASARVSAVEPSLTLGPEYCLVNAESGPAL